MKTDIIIRTPDGCVRYQPTGPETFTLVGIPGAITALRDLLPVLEAREDNQIGIAGDGLVHLLYLKANEPEDHEPRLVSHKEMQDRTLLDAPIVLFQLRDEDDGDWRTDRVLIDDDDLERFVGQQRHRYPVDQDGKRWRGFAVPMNGRLVNVVKQARDLANA